MRATLKPSTVIEKWAMEGLKLGPAWAKLMY
jgi:hypothetical protein